MSDLVSELMWIYGSVAVLATLFLVLKQPVVLAYIFAGILLGPSALDIIGAENHMETAAELGIVLLMFLIGLNLKLSDLIHLFRKTALLTLGTSILFAGAVVAILIPLGYSLQQSFIAGLALMFSSTVIGFKLIPTTDLHNKRIGEVMISILLFQDILAIIIILLMGGAHGDYSLHVSPWMIIPIALLFSVVAFGFVKYVIMKLFFRFDVIQEYIFVLSLGWCFLTAEAAEYIGLSQAIGAFIGGISLAMTPISAVIAERLKPIREFFLILFFFAIGARFNIHHVGNIFIPAMIIGIVLVAMKSFAFGKAFQLFGEPEARSNELGLRLGQASEFSLLVATAAATRNLIGPEMKSLIEMATIITFMISTYVVVLKYATPISIDAGNRRD